MSLPRVARRAVMLPLVATVELALLAAAPLLLAAAALLAVATRSSRPLRTAVLVLVYAGHELAYTARLTRPPVDWPALLDDALDAVHRWIRRVLDVDLVLEAGSVPPAALAGRRVVVLARHAGPGDSLLIAWLLARHYGCGLRVVLKHTLRLEPLFDIAGDHLPLCFVHSGDGRARAGVRDAASALRPGEALLLFPEGANFTWRRWRDAVLRHSRRGEFAAARAARRRTHTLPPRVGGVAAALQGAPDADVLLLAHSGFGDDGRGRPWWWLPVHSAITVRTLLVPAGRIPTDDDGLEGWLTDAWAQVDTWVEGHLALRSPAGA